MTQRRAFKSKSCALCDQVAEQSRRWQAVIITCLSSSFRSLSAQLLTAVPALALGWRCLTKHGEAASTKNIAWSRGLFSGPGGLADRRRRLEDHLAQEVEGPTSQALRHFLAAPIGSVREIPSALMRYLAWLAVRSLTMKTLYEYWIKELEPLGLIDLV